MRAYLKNKNIKRLMIRKNKSQNWLAYRLDISSGYMSQLMDGSRSPSPKVRQHLLNMFSECSFDDLFVIRDTKE